MNIETLDGKVMKWKMRRGKARKSSSLHMEAFSLTRELYPCEQIIEEIVIPVTWSQKLYGDIYLPRIRKLIEVHGKQHYEFSSLFHKSKADFLMGQSRDRKKKQWCDINNIDYVELPYNEKENWKCLIKPK